MSKNYKAIPVTMRDHLHELTNAELKVWLYLYLRTGKELTSFPGNQTIANACGMNIETAKIAKRGLRQKGWTKRLEQRRREDGLMSTVVEKSILPWAEKLSTDGGKPTHGTVGGKTVAGKSAQQKDYTEVPEVAATPIQDILEGSVLTDGSKKESKPVSLATTSLASPALHPASPESQNLSGCGDLTSEEQNQDQKQNQEQPQPRLPQTRQEMYDADMPEDVYSAADLLHRISPNITDAMVREQLPLCARILSFFADTGEYNVQAAELVLKFNRAHRSGKYANKDDKKLYIRTAAQFLKALESENAFLLNDYDCHDFKNCETCRGAGVFDYKEWIRNIRQEELRQAEQEEKNRLAAAQAAAHRAEQERLAKLCPECRKNDAGEHRAYRSGGGGWVKMCDPCYDRKYELQQEHLDMGKPLPVGMKALQPRPEYLEAKRKAEAAELAAKLDANEIDVPICLQCGQVTHAPSCPTRQPKIQEATA